VQRPILVTGAHRSGTTWFGEMLCLSPRIGMLLEPFNPITPPGISSGPFDRFFLYVTEENEGPFLEPLERTLEFRYALRRQLPRIRSAHELGRTVQDFSSFALNRVRRARPLLKDPIAVFSSEWLVSRFDAQPIVLIRHPAAFVSSLKKLGWTHRFEHFLSQPLLLRDHLGPYEGEIREFAERQHEIVDQGILLWRLIYSAVATFRERHPDWIFVRHEDASLDPVPAFERLFDSLGVDLDDGIRRSIVAHSAEGNPTELRHRHDVRMDSRASVESWRRRLTPDEIERIRAGVADVAPAFYSDDDW
jgi:Sulfotransferase family